MFQENNEKPGHPKISHPEVPVKNHRDNQRAPFDYSDPNLTFSWSVQSASGETLLPDFASGQIERLRKSNKKQIKIFRQGSAMFMADLVKMEYHKLDSREFIIPGQSSRLISRLE
jgi:hypothetical protein